MPETESSCEYSVSLPNEQSQSREPETGPLQHRCRNESGLRPVRADSTSKTAEMDSTHTLLRVHDECCWIGEHEGGLFRDGDVISEMRGTIETDWQT